MRWMLIPLALLFAPAAAWAQEGDASLDVKAFRHALKDRSALLLDVRTAEEFREGHIEGAAQINWAGGTLVQDLSGIDKEGPVLLYCTKGKRSAEAMEALKAAGFRNVHDLRGGIEAWKENKQPVISQ